MSTNCKPVLSIAVKNIEPGVSFKMKTMDQVHTFLVLHDKQIVNVSTFRLCKFLPDYILEIFPDSICKTLQPGNIQLCSKES